MGDGRTRAIAFSHVEQIEKILNEAARLKLQVLLRTGSSQKAIKANIYNYSRDESWLLIGSISPQGEEILRDAENVKVEFVLLSTKLNFEASVRGRATGKLLLQTPARLLSIENRQNAHFSVPAQESAFLEIANVFPTLKRFDSQFVPKFLSIEAPESLRLRVDDVGLGGVGCFTRYKNFYDVIQVTDVPLLATLYLPGHDPQSLMVRARWKKKTTVVADFGKYPRFEDTMRKFLISKLGTNLQRLNETYYRMGFQFWEPESELLAHMSSFIRKIQTGESV